MKRFVKVSYLDRRDIVKLTEQEQSFEFLKQKLRLLGIVDQSFQILDEQEKPIASQSDWEQILNTSQKTIKIHLKEQLET